METSEMQGLSVPSTLMPEVNALVAELQAISVELEKNPLQLSLHRRLVDVWKRHSKIIDKCGAVVDIPGTHASYHTKGVVGFSPLARNNYDNLNSAEVQAAVTVGLNLELPEKDESARDQLFNSSTFKFIATTLANRDLWSRGNGFGKEILAYEIYWELKSAEASKNGTDDMTQNALLGDFVTGSPQFSIAVTVTSFVHIIREEGPAPR
jgi:hypothetical protein